MRRNSISTSLVEETSSFRGITGVIGDEPGIHFQLGKKIIKWIPGSARDETAGSPGMAIGFFTIELEIE